MITPYISEAQELEALARALTAAPWVALDTEFVRERTYYARLCLLQVATPAFIACVDTLALPNLDVLLAALARPSLLKVLHAARQDLEVLHDLRRKQGGTTVLAPVFDTQIAAALLGHPDQIGYASLVEAVTGVRLAKLQTRTDWAARPLSAEQLHYAEDDVRYLCDVYQFFEKELLRTGRRDWLAEECTHLTATVLKGNSAQDAWQRIRAGQSLFPRAQVILRALAAWREREAQTRDLPRGWLIKDPVLVEIARRAPRDMQSLAGVDGLAASSVRNFGRPLLDAVQRGLSEPPVALWAAADRLDARQQDLYKILAAKVQECAVSESINATLIATRQDLLALIRCGDSAVLHGWRRALIGEQLLQLCVPSKR